MVRLWIKRILLGILIFIIAFISLKIVVFRLHSVTNIQVNGETVSYDKPKNISSNMPTKWDQVKGLKTTPKLEEDISIYYEGEKINLDIYEKDLRYYVDFKKFTSKIGGELTEEEDKEVLTYNGKKIEIHRKTKSYSKEYEALDFRGEILNIEDRDYVSINDIESMLDFRDTWDIDNKKIYIYIDKKHIPQPGSCKDGKAAFIRLEDVSSGATFKTSTAKEKMKIIGDNLYKKGVKFHVAWVPRYVDPSKGIDNDLLKNKTMENVQFINMLDYLIQKGGVIGLHGYTHQAGNEVSLNGFELTRKLNSSEKETRKVIESSITTAKTLKIPIGFFESPHYGSTRKQQRIIEDYFNVLYEPYTGYYNANPIYSFGDKNRLYVPAMIGYVKDKDGSEISKRIEKWGNIVLRSLFVHPFVETGYIDLGKPNDKGYRDYTYSEKSPLNNIIRALDKNGYVTVSVNSL